MSCMPCRMPLRTHNHDNSKFTNLGKGGGGCYDRGEIGGGELPRREIGGGGGLRTTTSKSDRGWGKERSRGGGDHKERLA